MTSTSNIGDDGMPVDGFVRLPTILARFPVSRSAWWKGVHEGRYPAAVKLGPRTTAWRVEDIRALLRDGPADVGEEADKGFVEGAPRSPVSSYAMAEGVMRRVANSSDEEGDDG